MLRGQAASDICSAARPMVSVLVAIMEANGLRPGCPPAPEGSRPAGYDVCRDQLARLRRQLVCLGGARGGR